MSEISKFAIKKGFDLKLKGVPSNEVEQLPESTTVAAYAKIYKGIKPRLKVKVGDSVKRGSVLFENKKCESFKVLAPASGVVKEIVLGERRSLERVIIEKDGSDNCAEFKKYNLNDIEKAKREELVSHLFATGLIALIQERPFSKIPDVESKPKSIFINGMNTGPFQPDIAVVVKGKEEQFKAGVALLNNLTEGKVHLCLSEAARKDGKLSESLLNVKGADLHFFSGIHPAGNSSIHINKIDPINVGDIVWAVKGVDVILLGELFLSGKYPVDRTIVVAGEGIKEPSRKYYQVKVGTDLSKFFSENLVCNGQRIISGDVLSGLKRCKDSFLALTDRGFTVIPESSEREFLGWLSPGLNKLSATRSFLSGILGGKTEWSLNTNKHGSVRAMVATGWYDRVMPLDIYVDVLVKAVLANDLDLAVKLGILETDPEDFALCTFVCPSKNEIQSVIEEGLQKIEAEGI